MEEEKSNIFSDIMNYTTPTSNVPVVIEGEVTRQTELEQDYEQSRENLKAIAELAQTSAIDMARMAKQMQEPRAYDVLSKVLATAIAAQKSVVELHKNKQDGKDPNEIPLTSVTNNTLILTTDELQRFIEQGTAELLEDNQQT